MQCSNQLSYEVTQLRAGQFVGLMFSRQRNVVWKKCDMKCGVWNQMKIWSSHLLDNLSNCLMNLKNSGDSTGFEPMTSAMPVQCSNQLSYKSHSWEQVNLLGSCRIMLWRIELEHVSNPVLYFFHFISLKSWWLSRSSLITANEDEVHIWFICTEKIVAYLFLSFQLSFPTSGAPRNLLVNSCRF